MYPRIRAGAASIMAADRVIDPSTCDCKFVLFVEVRGRTGGGASRVGDEGWEITERLLFV